jgi:hypothetical protein
MDTWIVLLCLECLAFVFYAARAEF